MRTICLINPNTSVATTDLMVGLARAAAGPGMSIISMTARTGAALITDPVALRVSASAVADFAPDISTNGVIVAAFGDPGVDRLRQSLRVPVIGIGEAAFREAAAGGRRFSIVTTTPLLEASIRANVALHGFSAQLASIRISHQDPVALMRDPPALQAALHALVGRCIDDDKADAIIVGGGPLAAAARALSGAGTVPIIEPVPAAARWMRRALSV